MKAEVESVNKAEGQIARDVNQDKVKPSVQRRDK
jgi:hypothetical protein